jgi:outer membrane protein assembly factor BamB
MSTDGSHQPTSFANVKGHLGGRRAPPKWIRIVLAALCLLVLIVRGTDIFADHAVANVATWIISFIAVTIIAVWFLCLSGYGWKSRLLALAGSVLVLALLAALFRIERVTGELAPFFALRFSQKSDRLLQPPVFDAALAEKPNVDLLTTTGDDFPQFLGPRRSAAVEHVKLARNWTDRPPQLVWRHEIGAGWPAFSIVNGHAVTMEQRGDLEMVTCYDLKTGKLEWAHSSAARYEKLEAGVGPRSTPTIDQGMVYALGALGHLMCIDGATGKCRWEKDLLTEFGITSADEAATVPWGRAASPLVVGEKVIVPVGGRKGQNLVSLAAYDKHTGALLWEGGKRQISYSSPSYASLAGAEQILSVNEDTVSGHAVNTGKVLWDYPWPGHTNADPNVSQAVPIQPDLVFLSKGYGQGAMLLKLEPATDNTLAAQVVWKNPKVLKTKFSNVAMLEGCVYGLSDGILECVQLSTDQSKWKQGRYGHGQILLVSDLLLVLTEEGEVVQIEAVPDRPNNVLGRFQAINGLTWNNFALYGPYLLVRNAEEAACYKLPLEK